MRKAFVSVLALVAALIVPAAAQDVYYPGNGVTLPTVIKEVHLIGPIDAAIGIDCVVSPDGTVGEATVAASPDPALDAVAIRALRQWRFQPGQRNGRPVPVRIYVEVSIDRQ
ncbi:MAG: energy transducer TonB [Vicinamibacterales bacterium]